MMYGCNMASESIKITVNLLPRAVAALEKVVDLVGGSKTDAINKALQIYLFLEQEQAAGKTILLAKADGTADVVKIL